MSLLHEAKPHLEMLGANLPYDTIAELWKQVGQAKSLFD